MRDGSVPDVVARHAGLVMTHAAAIASVLKQGELICPFAVITSGENRQSLAFEAPTQDEAVAKGWASLDELKGQIDLWALAREGLVRGPNGKEDVLLVAAWTHGMSEPAIFIQRFLPRARGGFALVGPIEVQEQPAAELQRIGERFLEGVHSHPEGHLWSTWRGDDA